jgi:small nuclear ribonucleoprotein (snRNP)-like protein
MRTTFLKKVTGVLKGYDQLLNLVLDEVEEQVQGNDIYNLSSSTSAFLNP